MNPFNLLKKHYTINDKKYVVVKKIGEGGFAFVYHVKGTSKENYAIKKMICQSNEQLNEANKERMILNKIKSDYVIPLLGTDILQNKKGYDEVILLLPLYDTSVQTIIDSGQYPYCSFIDGLDVVKILRHIAEGLAAVHACGYRHCDLKPANILLKGENMRAVLTDFGSASKLITVVNDRASALIVQDEAARYTTAPYRAPELFDTPSNCIIDGKSDIWSFGCLMYAMLFSRTPYETKEGLSTLAVMSSTFSYVEGHCWPIDYTGVIDECLHVDCGVRISIDQLLLKLKKLSSPPSSLSYKVVEKKHNEIALPLSSSSPPKSHKEKNNNSNTTTSHKETPVALFTADFADFENKFKSSTTINNDSKDNNEDNDRMSFGNFISSSSNITNDDEFGEFEKCTESNNNNNNSNFKTSLGSLPSSNPNNNKNNDNKKPNKMTITDSDILVKQIITDSTINIIKQGITYIMRPSGVFKKIIRKGVFIILSSSGLLIKKSDSKTSKIHHLLSFSQPLSVTSSDTSEIGLNGLLIDGFTPTIFMKQNDNDNNNNNNNNNNNYYDNDDNDDDDYDINHIKNNSNNDNSQFTKCRIIISFDSKETLGDWMDKIEYHHQLFFKS